MNELGLGGSPIWQTVKHTLTGAIPVGVAIFAPDQRLRHCTPDFPALTGLPHSRLPPGLPFNDLLAAFQQPPGTAAFRRQRSDGRVIEVHSEPLPDGGRVTIVTDITRVHETEDALLLSKAAAEAGHAAKARFLASMSDALRTPLASILAEAAGIAGTMDKSCARPASPAQIAGSCTAIDTAARSLLGLIDGILELARVETGAIDLADQRVDVAKLLRSILRRFDPIAAAAEVTLVVDLPVSLPAIRGDVERLRQVLSDVVAHALAGTSASGSVSIRVRHDWATGGLRLQVQDTGPSLTEQGLEQLFEPFQPGRHGRAAQGIGLYVGRMVMRAHGGDLAFGSAPGQGITATLTIPAARVVQDGGFDAN